MDINRLLSILLLFVGSPGLCLESQGMHFPPKWSQAPGTIEEFRKGDKFVVNPWNYLQRLGLYKIMLQKTKSAMEPFGPDNSENVIWGLPLHLGCQYSTQRIRDFSNGSSCGFDDDRDCISPNSWWAGINYYLSVIPFLGMVHAGYFPREAENIEIRPPIIRTELFCTDVSQCNTIDPDLILKWSNFFAILINTSKEQDHTSGCPTVVPVQKDVYMFNLWNAHVHSIAVGLRMAADLEGHLSAEERKFGLNWAHIVDYLAAVHFPTNNENTTEYQKFLPPRILWPTDSPPNIAEFTSTQNRLLWVMNWIHNVNDFTGDSLIFMWKRSMCSAEGRQVGRELFQESLTKPYKIPGLLVKLLWYSWTKSCTVF